MEPSIKCVAIAKEIIDDLLGRKGVGNELEACDDEVLEEITMTIAEIIQAGIEP